MTQLQEPVDWLALASELLARIELLEKTVEMHHQMLAPKEDAFKQLHE